jgi:uncharacterized protein
MCGCPSAAYTGSESGHGRCRDGRSSSGGMLTPAMASFEEISRQLAHPDSYPVRPATVEIRETHISCVFLAGDRAYKLEKPLALQFVDYSTAERRREMCHEEVRLNRRLAPDIYLGVRGVAPTDAGVAFTDDDDPRAVDFVVEMRRYDDRATLASALGEGSVEEDAVIAVCTRLAEFRRDAERIEVWAPGLDAQHRIKRNLMELLESIDDPCMRDRVWALGTAAHAFVARHAETLVDPARRGLVREGHGDLRAEHVLVDGVVCVVDCVEFDADLRRSDISDDLAFLVFDLAARRGALGAHPGAVLPPGRGRSRRGLADRVLRRPPGPHSGEGRLCAVRAAANRQRRAPARHCPRPLADRVRGTLRVAGAAAAGDCRVRRSCNREDLTRLGGRPRLGYLGSDTIRKQLAGIEATERGGEEIYGPEWNRRTYAEIGRRPNRELTNAGGVILDATFRHRDDREMFGRSFGAVGPVIFVECRAPAAALVARAAQRDRDPARVSDAGRLVVERERSSWTNLDEVLAEAHVLLRTDRPVKAIAAELSAMLDQRLKRAVGP